MSAEIKVTRTCPESVNRPSLKGSLAIGNRTCILSCEECSARVVFAAYDDNGLAVDPLNTNALGVAVGTCAKTGQHFTTPL